MSNKTGKFDSYYDKKYIILGYERFAKQIEKSISDGRSYLFLIRTVSAINHEATAENRLKLSMRIVLSDYTKTKIDEFTMLPCDSRLHPEIERFSLIDENNLSTRIVKIGNIYLEEAGWIAPNNKYAWLRIPANKYYSQQMVKRN